MATWVSLCALSLALAACQQQKEPATDTGSKPPAAATPAIPAVPAPGAAAPAPAATAATAVPPETVLAVSQALAAATAFNAKTAEDLAVVDKAQKRIHDLAVQAAADAQRGGSSGENERLALGRKVANARTEAEAAHADLVSRQTAFRTVSQSQTDAVAAALVQCGASPEFATSEACVKLLAEQTTLTKSTAALVKGFGAAEAAYQKDRVRLDEASATMALGIR
jgi:hypothetical protein